MASLERVWMGACLLVLGAPLGSPRPHLGFTSHVSFATPGGGYSHSLGGRPRAPFRPALTQRAIRPTYVHNFAAKSISSFRDDDGFRGYPSGRPAVPFPLGNAISPPGPHSSYAEDHFAGHGDPWGVALPASPYRVDSPNAESLWPEGLQPSGPLPPRFGLHDKSDLHHQGGYLESYENNILDPYLLEGIEASRAYARIEAHGELFHHEIPHVRALLANQHERSTNGLRLHRLGSIRPSSPWLRA